MTIPALEAYLSDHLADSAGDRDLAASVMPDVALEIEADRTVLESLAYDLGIRKPRRPGKRDATRELLALEAVALGVARKLLLWKALREADDAEQPAVRGVDLDHLIARATKQFDEVERERLRRAAQLFGGPVTVSYG